MYELLMGLKDNKSNCTLKVTKNEKIGEASGGSKTEEVGTTQEMMISFCQKLNASVLSRLTALQHSRPQKPH